MSWYAKLRYGPVGFFYLRLNNNWKPLERYTAAEWIRQKMGEEYYNILWRPSLIGKFGDRYEEVNMAWLWARSETTLPIPGFRTVAQVEENCGALHLGALNADQMSQINTLLER